MAQRASTTWSGAVSASFREFQTGVLVSFQQTTSSGVNYFTIGTSEIGGADIIKGGGDFVTFFDQYDYNDYTLYAKDWSVERKIGQFPFGLIMGQADITFNNASNKFTPNFDAQIGEYILPNRPVKLSLQFGSDSLQQFVGFTGQPEMSIGNRSMVMHAYDALNYLNNYQFTASGLTYSGMIVQAYTHQIIDYYLQILGFSPTQYTLDTSLQQPIGYISVMGRKFGDVLKDLVEAEQGLLFCDENGSIKFWNRQHFLTSSGLGESFNFNYSNIVTLEYENTAILNDVIVKAKPRSVSTPKRLWKNSSAIELPPNSATPIFADFSDDFGELPATAVIAPTYNTKQPNTSYYQTNVKSDGSGAAFNSYVAVQSTYLFGSTFKIVFTNSYANTIYLTDLTLYGTPAEVVNVIEQRWTDSDSINKYGRNPANNGEAYVIENDFIQDDATANSLAYTVVQEFKEPRRHYIAQVFANPALQIGDYGSLTIPETNETRRVFITAIRIKNQPNGDLTQELHLEERTLKSYFTVGTSLIGGADEIAP